MPPALVMALPTASKERFKKKMVYYMWRYAAREDHKALF